VTNRVLTRSRRASSLDAVSVLSVFVLALFAIPSELIVGPLGAAGTPAEIVGVCLFAGWLVMFTSNPSLVRGVRQPVRWLLWAFVIAVTLSYIAANSRSMMPDESRSADAALLLVAAWAGILLTTMDLIRSRDRLDVLLRRLVFAGGALATLGLLQFVTKQPFTDYIQIPGLQENQSLVSIYGRNGLARPAGTAVHPIEFGAALTMILPLALHYAMTDTYRHAVRRWYPVLAIGLAVPISISRSAVVSTIIVLCFVLPTWSATMRRRAYAAILALGAAVFVAVPGLIGTIAQLFTGISADSSAQSRTGSFSVAFEFIERAPLFGRGFLTFLPAYRILDDQYLGLLIDTGIVGMMAFLGLLVAGVVSALRTRRRAIEAADASLGIALAASTASALASFAFFDAFSFPMAASCIFLILGTVGALTRFVVVRQPEPVAV
jgi:polysaccharide biosynthesis protein PslJ